MKPSAIKKRSISISGRKTSVSLEDEFWELAKDIARRKKVPVTELIDLENKRRDRGNLSSCVRPLVLRDLHERFLAAEARLVRLKAQ